MAENCLIKKTKKQRVSGNNGPRRHQMLTHGQITNNVPKDVLEQIYQIAVTYTGNDLGGDN